MKSLRFLPLLALAAAFSLGLNVHGVHAQAIGQPCPDFICDGDAVCKGSPPTCQANTAALPGSDGSTGGITGTTNTSGGSINTSQLQGYEQSIVTIINSILVPLLVAVAFIVFLWGVFNYFIRGAAEPEKRKEGAQYVLWGVIGFVLIFSVWGLVNLLMGTLGLTAGSLHPGYPTL